MSKITIDDLVTELDNALQLAIECSKPSAMIQATMAKARLLNLDRIDSNHDDTPQPVQIIVNVRDARKPELSQ